VRVQDILLPSFDVQISSAACGLFPAIRRLSTGTEAGSNCHEKYHMPITMIEKLATNMAIEVKAARSRRKSVITRLPFPLCSFYVLFMFDRQAAAAHLLFRRFGDGKQFLPAFLEQQRPLDAGRQAD